MYRQTPRADQVTQINSNPLQPSRKNAFTRTKSYMRKHSTTSGIVTLDKYILHNYCRAK